MFSFKPTKRQMGRIWFGTPAIGAPLIVKIMNQFRIPREPFGCGNIVQIVFCPEPVLVTKRPKPAFGGYSGSGQDYNRACHFSLRLSE